MKSAYRVEFCLFRYLIPLLLQYDSTAEESDKTDARGVGTSVQKAKNSHAVQASNALSRLSGLGSSDSPAPYNEAAADALKSLLTPKLASMLKDKSPKDLLSVLNSNLESSEVSAQCLQHNRLTFYHYNFICLTCYCEILSKNLCFYSK